VAAEGAAEEAPNPRTESISTTLFGISFSSHVLYCVELTQPFFRTLNRNVLVLTQPNITSKMKNCIRVLSPHNIPSPPRLCPLTLRPRHERGLSLLGLSLHPHLQSLARPMGGRGHYRNVRHHSHASLRGHLLRADAPEGLLRQAGELYTPPRS